MSTNSRKWFSELFYLLVAYNLHALRSRTLICSYSLEKHFPFFL